MLWNIHADKIARIALFEHENKCVCSHTNCIVAAVIVLTISLFCLLWLVRKLSLLLVLSLVLVLKRQFNELINGKGQRNKHQKSNLLFLQRHDQSQNFDSNLLTIGKKHYKEINIYWTGYIKIKVLGDCEIIYRVNPLHFLVNHVNGYLLDKKWK